MKHLPTTLSLTPLVALLLVSCGSDEYLGSSSDVADVERGTTISFNGGTGKASRAAMLEGAAAAEKLGNEFVVFGTKTVGGTTQTVFDHYTVGYATNTAMTTASNSSDWEYVGQPLSSVSTLAPGTAQTIKFWDFGADRYDFVALSGGSATLQGPTLAATEPGYPGPPAAGSVIVTPVKADALTTSAYTLAGQTADIARCYIADRITSTKSATRREGISYPYRDAMKFGFHTLSATVRLGLYETIPGYSVRDVRFYQQSGSLTADAVPALFATFQTIPNGRGIVSIAFPETDPASDAYNRAAVTYSPQGERGQSLALGSFAPSGAPEQNERGGSIYLGRTAPTASLTTDAPVLPVSASDLTLKVDFTLVSVDYNETINVRGATAVIPATYTHWLPNHAYTYLFKITDKVTTAEGPALYPIRFDALETIDDSGMQQTITTVDQPSITTYAKGAVDHEYYAEDHIYISVTNGTPRHLSAANAKLYTVALTDGLTEADITEKELTEETIPTTALTPVPDGFMSFVDHIDALDSPSGERIESVAGSNFAKFSAAANNIYVFEFIAADATMYADAAEYNAANSTSLNDSEFAALSIEERTKEPAEKHYKVIRVGTTPRPTAQP